MINETYQVIQSFKCSVMKRVAHEDHSSVSGAFFPHVLHVFSPWIIYFPSCNYENEMVKSCIFSSLGPLFFSKTTILIMYYNRYK